jgi:two-component system C4-dicarboxylate transport sensor histidine kinase DctB
MERVNRQALATRLLTATVHDVSNALQVVSGAAEVLAMDPTPAAVEKRTGSIVGQALQATVTLKALSAFIRAPETPPQPVDLRHLAAEVVALRQFTFRRLRIETRVEGDAAVGVASPRRLLQAALNLCVNAEQAAASGSAGMVVLTTGIEGECAYLRVLDNGPGVSAATLPTLFAWPQTCPAGGDGLGIGLATSRALLALDGGTLHHEAPPDGGAAFTMAIPRASR